MKRFAMAVFGAAVLAAPMWGQDLPPDLAAVPGDALGFIHVRVADVWKGEALKDLRKVIEKAGPEHLKMLDERFVPAPSSIDQATIIFWAPADPKSEVPIVTIVTTNAAFDGAKLLKGALPGAKPATAATAQYFADESNGMALRVVNDRTIMFGSIESMKQYLSKKGIRPGIFEPAVRSAASGRSLVLAVNPSLAPKQIVAVIPPDLLPLLKANLLQVAIDLGNEAKIDMSLRYANESETDAAEKALQGGLGMAKKLLADYKKQAEGKLFAKNKGEHSALEDLPEAAAALAAIGFVNRVEEILKNLPLKRERMALAASVNVPEGPYTMAVSSAAVGAGLLLPAVQRVRDAAARMQSSNNIKQMSLAFHNYDSTYGRLPAAAICDGNGKPLLSWRVAILPYIEQVDLYKQFKLDEPWDSPHNIKLIQQMPQIYRHPNDKGQHKYPSTYYQVLVGNNAAFELKRGLRFADFTDGTSNTIWLVEAEKAVPWTKPEDINYDGKTMPKLGKFWPAGYQAGFADGSVRFIVKSVPESTWHLLIQRNDGQVIPNFD